MLSVYSNYDKRSNLEIDHTTYPTCYHDNYLMYNNSNKHCNGFVKQIDPSQVKDLKKVMDSREHNGNIVNALPCTQCNVSNNSSSTIRPQISVDSIEDKLPLINVTWPVNNAGFVGHDAEEIV